MSIDKDKRDDWTEEDPGQWTKEPAKQDRRFDFNAFLGPESLEDRVTDVLDGKDVLREPSGSDYVPRRTTPDRERGRHEAPGPDPEEEEDETDEGSEESETAEPDEEEDTYDDGLDTRRFDANGTIPPRTTPGQPPQFRQENVSRPNVNDPPPRPKVVVAAPTPAPRVVVTPDRQYPDSEPPQRKSGGGKAMKWLMALLISLVIVALIGAAAVFLLPGLLGGGTDPLASPTPGTQQTLPTQIPATNPPTQPPTAPPVAHHTVSVTAGSGGSVTPGGAVDVQDGATVTFTITPDPGYELGQLLVDGSPVSLQSSYTFSNVERDHTLYAVFQQSQTPPPLDTPEPTAEPTSEPASEPTAEPQPETTPEPEGPPPVDDVVSDLGPAA